MQEADQTHLIIGFKTLATCKRDIMSIRWCLQCFSFAIFSFFFKRNRWMSSNDCSLSLKKIFHSYSGISLSSSRVTLTATLHYNLLSSPWDVSSPFPALYCLFFSIVFHFCWAGFASFDWWRSDWVNFSVISQGDFPQHTGCLSECLQAADMWAVVGAAMREMREKGSWGLTSCWTLDKKSWNYYWGQCILKCLDGVWEHKDESERWEDK